MSFNASELIVVVFHLRIHDIRSGRLVHTLTGHKVIIDVILNFRKFSECVHVYMCNIWF